MKGINKRTSLIAVVVTCALVALCTKFADKEQTKFLLQTASGNWSPPANFVNISEFEFAITGIFAVIINWSPLIGAFALVYGYIKPVMIIEERNKDMILKQAFDVTEEATKLALSEEFPDDKATLEKINKAFEKGHEMAKDHIKAAFGSPGLDIFLKSLNREMK
jgi:hypothetical protein